MLLHKKNPRSEKSEYLLVIQKKLKQEILRALHDEPSADHWGFVKILNRISTRFYWDDLQKDFLRYVKGCESYQSRKGPSNVKPAGLLQSMPIGKSFDWTGIDLLGPFKKSRNGNKMIICAIDYCTKWVETRALSDEAAKGVAKFILEDIICRHGAPRHILTDRGKVSSLMWCRS